MKREEFWKEVNEARKLGESRFWKGAFPEASVLDMNCLMDVNQYISTTTGNNAFKNLEVPLYTSEQRCFIKKGRNSFHA